MNSISIASIVESIKEISQERGYWFVRTQGGDYYDEFVTNSFVGIGYDEISLADISKTRSQKETDRVSFINAIVKAFPEERRPNYIGNQLIDFAYNLKKGDIIAIPSFSSSLISIGEVVTTPVYLVEKRNFTGGQCPFLKRKHVKWHKINIPFDSLDPNLIFLKYSQRTITRIEDYKASFIDRILNPLFIKNGDAHLSLNIRSRNPIKAVALFQTWLELFQISEEIGKAENLEVNKEEYDVKINVQSPGTIEFISYSAIGITLLSVIVVCLSKSKFSEKNGLTNNFQDQPVFNRITDFLNTKSKQFTESLVNKVKAMDISTEEVIELVNQIGKKQ
jgi:restriction system protein